MAIAPDKDELPEAINPGATHGEAIGSFAGKPLYHASLNAGPCLPATGSPFSGMGRTILLAAARPSDWPREKPDDARVRRQRRLPGRKRCLAVNRRP